MIQIAAGDSLFLHTYYPNGVLASTTTLLGNSSNITATTALSTYRYVLKANVADIDGTPGDGAYTYVLTLWDIDLDLPTPHIGEFQLYQTLDYNTAFDSVLAAIARLDDIETDVTGLNGASPPTNWADMDITVTTGEVAAKLDLTNDVTGALGDVNVANDILGQSPPVNWDDMDIEATTGEVTSLNANFDSLKYIGQYGLGVYLDAAAANTNTVVGIDGTFNNPVSTLAAARTIADALGIQRYYIINRSTFTLAADHQDWHFVGVGFASSMVFGSQRVDGAVFENLRLSGALHASGGDVYYTNCVFGYVSANWNGHARDCWLTDTIVVTTGNVDIQFNHCQSGVAGPNTPTIDLTGVSPTAVSIRNYSGGIRLMNGAANDTVSIETDGQVVISANNTSLSAVLRGNMTVTDSGVTTILNEDAALNRPVIADAVLDEVNTAAQHNISQSLGRQIRQLADVGIIYSNTATDGGMNWIELDAGASATDGTYDPSIIQITGGTGDGQAANILQYEGATKRAWVDRDWKIEPDATSEFSISPDAGREHVNEGAAQGGTSTTITLNALASSFDDAYNGQVVFIRSGTGADQARNVIDYDGTSKVATVDTRVWDVIPTDSTVYVMLPTAYLERAALALLFRDSLWSPNYDAQLKSLTISGANGATGSLNVINSTGPGVTWSSTGGNGDGFVVTSNGSGNAVSFIADLTGVGFSIGGGSTSGHGFSITATNGHAFNLAGGTLGDGLHIEGGSGGGEGAQIIGGGAAADILADITGTVTPTDTNASGATIARVSDSADFKADVSALALEASLFDPVNDSVIVDGSEFAILEWATNLLQYLGWGQIGSDAVWAQEKKNANADTLWVGTSDGSTTIDTLAYQVNFHVGGTAGDPPDSVKSYNK